MNLDDPKSWVVAVLGVLTSLFAWSAKRQMDHSYQDHLKTAKELEDHSLRLRQLEASFATRADIERLHTHINTLTERMNTQHVQILNALNER